MRIIIGIMCLTILICAAACAADAPASSSAPVASAQSSDPEYEKLAATGPAWAPVPVFRNSASAIPFLTEVMQSPDADSRARAAFMLGQIGDKGSARLLAEGLTDKSRTVRIHCGIALACMGDRRGTPTCATALTTESDWVRYYAAYGLWCINSEDARRALKRSGTAQSQLVAMAVQGALNSPAMSLPKTQATAKQANKLTPDDVIEMIADTYTRESEYWWHVGDYEQGIRCMEALVFIDPSDVQSFGLIAWLHKNLGRSAAAESTLKRAVAANPKSADAYFELGLHYMTAKDYTRAAPALRQAVDLGGDHLARRQYAHSLENLGKLRECLDQWGEILRIMPNDSAAKLNHDRVEKLLAGG